MAVRHRVGGRRSRSRAARNARSRIERARRSIWRYIVGSRRT